MKKYKDKLIGLFAVVLLAGAAVIWLGPERGDPAPDVTYNTLDGQTLTTAGLAGKPTLVTFWATTCVSCIQEMPHLMALYQELHPRGLQMIGVAMEYDPPKQVEALVKARQVNYPIALDTDGSVARAFGNVRLTPTTFLINPEGRISSQRIGEVDMDQLRDRIIRMLPAEQQASTGDNRQG